MSSRKPRRLRWIRVLATCLPFLLIASACGDGSAGDDDDSPDAASADIEPAAEGEEVELTVWFGREQMIPDDAFESFHERYPNIQVNTDVAPNKTVASDLLVALAAGTPPDIAVVNPAWMGAINRAGA